RRDPRAAARAQPPGHDDRGHHPRPRARRRAAAAGGDPRRARRGGRAMRSRLLWRDVAVVGSVGLRTRRLRAALSALGIAIGIASMVAVLGISESSKADLLAQLDALGTNLLTVSPGQSFLGDDATLPGTAVGAAQHMPTVDFAASVADVNRSVRRSEYIDAAETGGIALQAADPALLATLDGRMRRGRFLDAATERYPVIVLGSVAAQRLGVSHVGIQVA